MDSPDRPYRGAWTSRCRWRRGDRGRSAGVSAAGRGVPDAERACRAVRARLAKDVLGGSARVGRVELPASRLLDLDALGRPLACRPVRVAVEDAVWRKARGGRTR